MEYNNTQEQESLAIKPVKIDLNDPTAALPDDELVMDPNADAFAGPAPVPDGEHIAKLSLGQRGFETGRTKNGTNYVMAHIEARIQAPGKSYDNHPVFDTVSSLVFENSGTSKMAGVFKATGESVPSRSTLREFAQAFGTMLAGNPLVKVTTRWEAYSPEAENPKSKSGFGKVILRGMRKFPELTNGTYKHTIECPETGAQLTAQAKITNYAKA